MLVMRAGYVFLDTFEHLGGDQYRLHSKTKVIPTQVGPNKVELPEAEWIAVRKRYVIGLHYPDANSIPLVPYADSLKNLSVTPYRITDLSEVYEVQRHDDSLDVGATINVISAQRKRLPSVKVHFSSKY